MSIGGRLNEDVEEEEALSELLTPPLEIDMELETELELELVLMYGGGLIGPIGEPEEANDKEEVNEPELVEPEGEGVTEP